jgi:PAS domain S-box-containing protein
MDHNQLADQIRELGRRAKEWDEASSERDGESHAREGSILVGDLVRHLKVAQSALRDLHDRAAYVEQLASERARRYQRWFEDSPVGFVVTDPEGNIVEVNRAAADLLGDSSFALVDRGLDSCVAGDDRRAFLDMLSAARKGGAPHERRLNLRRSDGWTAVACLSVKADFGWDHEPESLTWALRTPRPAKTPETALDHPLRAPGRLRGVEPAANPAIRPDVGDDSGRSVRLLNSLGAIVWEADQDGRLRFLNAKAAELLGYADRGWRSAREFLKLVTHPDDLEWTSARRAECARLGRPGEIEYRTISSGGAIIRVWESIRPVLDASGGPDGLCGMIVSIEKWDRLAQRHEELRRDLAATTYIHGLGRCQGSQPEAAEFLNEILGCALAIDRSESGAIRLLDPASGALDLVVGRGLPSEYAKRFRRLQGGASACGAAVARCETVVVEDVETTEIGSARAESKCGDYRAVHSTALVTRSGQPLGAIDVFFKEPRKPTPRQVRMLEVLARQAADFLEIVRLSRGVLEAERRFQRVLAVLAHELRTPLAVVQNASLVLRLATRDEESADQAYVLVARQVKRMAKLVDDILDHARIARDEINLNVERVDVGELLARVAESMRPLIHSKGHVLEVVEPSRRILLKADPNRLEQIIVNLLANAARYTEPGGKIALRIEREGDEVVLRVSDNGIGIAPETASRIFEPFVRIGRADSPSTEGLGLGLSLVKALAERHGGGVSYSSEGPGRGSEFVVRLPASVGQDEDAPIPS